MPIRRKVTKKKATKKRAVRKVAKKATKKRTVRRLATINDADEFARLIKRMSRSTSKTVQYDRTRNEGSGQITGLGEIFFWEGNDGINFQILGPIRIKAESNRQALRVLEQLQRVVFDS